MSEESILILNMLREGKVSAEQADSLLRAVRETAPPPAAAPPPPVPPVPPHAPHAPADPSILHGKLGDKLGDLQAKLGELQGKLGAAAASRMADSAASLAGKVVDKIPKPEIEVNVNKIIDEAMRGLHSIKGEAMRTAREAARQARDEVRKAGREGRRAMKWDFKFDFNFPDGGNDAGRPENREELPEALDVAESVHNWTGAQVVLLSNPCGNLVIRGGEADGMARVKLTRRVWAVTEAEARALLPQVFLTTGVENDKWAARIVAPADARDRVIVDAEVFLPANIPIEAQTTHGDIQAEGVSPALALQSASGKITARGLSGDWSGDAQLTSRSGAVEVDGWHAPNQNLVVETQSGDVRAEAVTTKTLRVTSRSGDLSLGRVATSQSATLETFSGDLRLEGGSAREKLSVKTQSGGADVSDFRADTLQIETVSGDLNLRETSGVLSIKTVSGDMEAAQVSSPAVSLGTVSGDARLAFAAPFNGSLAATTVSGDLTVALRTNSDTRIEMNTLSGDLACGLPLEDKSPDSDKRLAGKLGDGTGSVKLQSVSGDLRVEAQS